jgi:hypothetical protein
LLNWTRLSRRQSHWPTATRPELARLCTA